ncbi:MAG: hypothetical protein K5945_05020 [Bacteroidaceae bacterium]|nr:hypothetical protein [Bacteroidaceae bacterium]
MQNAKCKIRGEHYLCNTLLFSVFRIIRSKPALRWKEPERVVLPRFSRKKAFRRGRKTRQKEGEHTISATKRDFLRGKRQGSPFAVFETKMPFFEVSPPTFSKKESEKTEKAPLKP